MNQTIRIGINHQFSNSGFSISLDTEIPAQGITAIFGHSGSGKTTLLRLIAGLEACQSGRIVINDQTWLDEHSHLPAHKRSLGYVFQESSLLPHLSVEKNLRYAIKRCKNKPDQAFHQKVLDVMGIQHLMTNSPDQLSGGERQRVAMARALLIQPDILLMDEPLASLDEARKQEILPYLESLNQAFQIPILYVSHSVEEVARLADHVLVMEEGEIKHQGNVHDVFSRLEIPLRDQRDTSVVLKGTVVEKDLEWHLAKIQLDDCHLWTKDNGEEVSESLRIRILAKDVSIALSKHDDSSILNKLPVIIEDILEDDDPAMSLIKLKLNSDVIYARLTRRSVQLLGLKQGMGAWAQIKSVAIVR